MHYHRGGARGGASPSRAALPLLYFFCLLAVAESAGELLDRSCHGSLVYARCGLSTP